MRQISLIITAKNESETISRLLESIANQTRKPDEVIISMAGENENYPSLRQAQGKLSLGVTNLTVKIITLHGDANRAVGRNKAIEVAKYEHILITDAGCRLKETWVEEMEKGFEKADVVAGFYEGEYENLFEKCELPYVLVMPDKINRKTFLPATRSMGITKRVWTKVGKFNEKYRYAEDYEFARRIQKLNITIQVVPEAIVYWRPRKNLSSFARMLYEHAFGDGYSQTYRPKVATIFVRYMLFILFGIWHWSFGIGVIALYLIYSIHKNYRYIQDLQAIFILPTLQVVSDFAVMWGTTKGAFERIIR